MNSLITGPSINLKSLINLRYAAGALKLFQRRPSKSALSGGHRSAFRGRGMDFDEVRLYQAGDDVRHIDWRVSARTQKTHTKIFKEEKDRPLLLIVDQRSSMCFGTQVTYKSVMAAQLASLLAWAGIKDNDKIGGIVFNDAEHKEVKPKRSHNALLTLLHVIEDFNQRVLKNTSSNSLSLPSSSLSLHEILKKLQRIAKPGSAVFIFSDFNDYDADVEKHLHLLKRHVDIYLVGIADPMEKQLPAYGNLSVSDGDKKFHINTRNKKLLKSYQQSFDNKQNKLIESFKKLGLSYQCIWTNDEPIKALQGILRPSAINATSSNSQNSSRSSLSSSKLSTRHVA